MKTKSFLILALAAWLAGLATPAKASIVYADLNSYQVTGQGAGVVYAAPGNLLTTGLNLTVGFLGIDPNGNGVGFMNYFSSEDPEFGSSSFPAAIYGNTATFLITSSTLSKGSTVGGISSFANGGYVYPTVIFDEQYIGAAAAWLDA